MRLLPQGRLTEKMREIVIYGASDDLIEVEPTDFPAEEFNVSCDDENLLLAVSDGTVLRVEYDVDGVWRFRPVLVGSANLDIWICPADHESKYSDRVTLTGEDLRWVVFGSQIAK
jgi:hypothetical protein